ncbi:MAG: hypothetical protein NVS9B10_22840 [Nevskia sp.]
MLRQQSRRASKMQNEIAFLASSPPRRRLQDAGACRQPATGVDDGVLAAALYLSFAALGLAAGDSIPDHLLLRQWRGTPFGDQDLREALEILVQEGALYRRATKPQGSWTVTAAGAAGIAGFAGGHFSSLADEVAKSRLKASLDQHAAALSRGSA